LIVSKAFVILTCVAGVDFNSLLAVELLLCLELVKEVVCFFVKGNAKVRLLKELVFLKLAGAFVVWLTK
jgi:hypothetical protein